MELPKTHRRCFPLPWDSHWLRVLWVALFLGLLLGQEVRLFLDMVSVYPRQALDFFQHYMLGVWLNHGGSVTDVLWPERVGMKWHLWMYGVIPFLPYQPLLLPGMRLLAQLPPQFALLVWQGGMVLVWWWMTRSVARMLGVSPWCIRLLLFLFPPFWQSLYLGNVDGYLAALVTGALVLRHRKQWTASGYVWGWVGAFKPFLLLGSLPLIRDQKRSSLVGLLLGVGHAGVVAWLVVGTKGLMFFGKYFNLYMERTISRFLAHSGSLLSWLSALVGTPTPVTRPMVVTDWPVEEMVFVMTFLLLLTTLWIWFRSTERISEPAWDEGLWLITAFLVVPLSWSQYRLYLFLPGVVLTYWLATRKGKLASLWFLLLPLFLTAYIWTRDIVHFAAPYRVVALYLGTVHLAIWLFFIVATWQRTKEVSVS